MVALPPPPATTSRLSEVPGQLSDLSNRGGPSGAEVATPEADTAS